jgi:hypothetical protein
LAGAGPAQPKRDDKVDGDDANDVVPANERRIKSESERHDRHGLHTTWRVGQPELPIGQI